MPISQTHIAPPEGFTGEPVEAASIRSVGKHKHQNTREEGNVPKFQVLFNLKDAPNPVFWDAPGEEECDDCVAEVTALIAETVVITP